MGEIVDVTGGLEVFDRLGVREDAECEKNKRQQADLRANVHRKIVQERRGLSLRVARATPDECVRGYMLNPRCCLRRSPD